MIDIKFIKQSLKPKKEKRSGLITLDDLITPEVQEIFYKSDWYISTIVSTFFAKQTPEEKKAKKKSNSDMLDAIYNMITKMQTDINEIKETLSNLTVE